MSRRIDSCLNAESVTPTDDTYIGDVDGIYVGGAGDVAVKMRSTSSSLTFTGVAAGSILPIKPFSIQSTNTTATGIIRIWN